VKQWEDKKGWETIPRPPNNLIQDSEGDEENGYPVTDSNKTKINDVNKPNPMSTRTTSKKKSCK
jgi:hypothetical protein